ncbi:hypothetical protein CE91St43_28030 [Oscillospiraceae bacterium]|nr:hypothetical protein CE91St43_28030 [Oscillospiraceae bacterium]
MLALVRPLGASRAPMAFFSVSRAAFLAVMAASSAFMMGSTVLPCIVGWANTSATAARTLAASPRTPFTPVRALETLPFQPRALTSARALTVMPLAVPSSCRAVVWAPLAVSRDVAMSPAGRKSQVKAEKGLSCSVSVELWALGSTPRNPAVLSPQAQTVPSILMAKEMPRPA